MQRKIVITVRYLITSEFSSLLQCKVRQKTAEDTGVTGLAEISSRARNQGKVWCSSLNSAERLLKMNLKSQ